MNVPAFTAHNIRLDNGELTKPGSTGLLSEEKWFISARKILNLVFPGDQRQCKIVDLGCLEGGYSVEFARMGFDTLGIEVRDVNFRCCEYARERTNLPNLRFAQDDVLNIANYGEFDAAFCCGLLYHLDRPRVFLEQLAKQTKKLLIVQTHFSLETEAKNRRFNLSPITANESLKGRWFAEFPDNVTDEQRQASRWSSFNNNASFWIQREHLIGLIHTLGFGMVLEQFDSFGPDIATELEASYSTVMRGTFIGIKDA